jgi:Zn-dependent protease with chaperone function
MNTDRPILQGSWFDGMTPVAIPASLHLDGHGVTLNTDRESRNYEIARLSVSPRTGHAPRFILLPDGGQFLCADGHVLDPLPQESPSEGPVAWLESRVAFALAGVAIIFALVGFGYFYGLPWAAERIVPRIPIATEVSLGKTTLAWLDDHHWLRPSRLKRSRREEIRTSFDELRSGLPMEQYLHLKFRDAPFIGANAFALPGGTIVITDQMVAETRNLAEVEAVLGHEIGHVEHRHAMRSLLQNSAVALVAATLTGDAASLSTAVAGLPVVLARTRYSREFESEADEYDFALLKKHGVSPMAFAILMQRLSAKTGKNDGALAFLSTHPVTAERIRRAEEAAGTGRVRRPNARKRP